MYIIVISEIYYMLLKLSLKSTRVSSDKLEELYPSTHELSPRPQCLIDRTVVPAHLALDHSSEHSDIA